MNLLEHYDAMRVKAVSQLLTTGAEPDRMLHSGQDARRGITLLARPPESVTAGVSRVLADFQLVAPEQYYYPAADMHLTILSIISCFPGFLLTDIAPAAYQEVVRAALEQVGPFVIRYAGLTASAGGLMVQGFPEDDTLNRLRNKLRTAFRRSGLPQSIDQRYALQTAHSTVLRFTTPLHHPARLVAALQSHQHTPIGTFQVDTLELVYNDWYQRAANTVVLERYPLTGS
ncbi:mutarotase [Hymenobacter sp. HSC-4F20]|uniref:2'-5' RNA ligase family protein n=1 Tax=Hymenobacter sp. HSC-4F20 TaxID=2864135 RepID=UPI001C73DC01|nr:mutarotase [Hymenobacter sp. HSC-4F20]MBX0289975.1 mutarotase [Hymenobacter sp. HSC-4F20]